MDLIVSIETTREFFYIESNETPSVIPRKYLNLPSEEEIEEDPDLKELFRNSVKDLYRFSGIESPINEAVDLSDSISTHFGSRIQTMLLQLCLCYNTHLVFNEQNGAEAQATLRNSPSNLQLAEAHCSTFPSLKYWSQADEEAAYANPPKDIVPQSLGKMSFYFKLFNTTNKLPVSANHVDSAIDFQKNYPMLGNQTFRSYCIGLLNRVSNQQMTPHAALTNYLDRIIQVLESLSYGETEGEFEVRRNYLSCAKYYRKFIEIPENFQKLLHEDHCDYQEIQKKRWSLMTRDMKAYQIVDRIEAKALEIIRQLNPKKKTDVVSNRELLVPGILLNYFSAPTPFDRKINQIFAKLNMLPNVKQVKHSVACSRDPEFSRQVQIYFESFDTDGEIFADFDDPKGKWQKLFVSLKGEVQRILELQPHQVDLIFWLTLKRIYQHSYPSSKQKVAEFLSMNDGLLDSLVKPTMRKYINSCSANAEIQAMARSFVELL